MKIEKINENKIKIILTIEELENRKISLKELENDTTLARNLFFDLIEENNLDEEFKLEDSQLLIEASSDNENLFIVTITKVDNLPSNINNFCESNNTNGNIKKQNNYKVTSNIFVFEKIDDILSFCDKAKSQITFLGRNSLYKNDNNYFLIFSNNATKNKKFISTFSLLSEYCTSYHNFDMLSITIKEKCKLIIANNAIQKLMKI